MRLVLQSIAPNGEPGGQRLTGQFDEGGGTIGRSEDATLTLPDPQRVISRLQAHILCVDGNYWIENVSAASQILRNGKRLIAGKRVILHEGDVVKIGDYAFLASIVDDQERTMVLGPLDRTAVLGPQDRTAALGPHDRTVTLGPHDRTAALGPHDRTAILGPQDRTAVLGPQDRTAALGPHDRTVTLGPLDRTAILGPQDRMAPLGPLDRTAVLGPHDRTVTLGPQERKAALGLKSDPRDSQATPTLREKALTGTLNQPLPNAMSPAADRSRQPPQSPPRSQTDSRSEVLWRSFLEGAGIESMLPNSPSPELMRDIGEVLRTAVAGIQSLIAIRAKAKNEMHADMTLIQVHDNNPLKLSPDVELALERILQPSARGFLTGSAALRGAVTDLQSHQIGMTAGMRAAMEATFKRFDPARIEALPTRRRLLERLSPVHRRARLWELYADQHNTLREEAWNNFERCFVEALREGYETAVRSHDSAFDPPDAGPGKSAR